MLPAVAALSLSMVLSPLSPMSLSRPLAPTRAEHALPQYESLGMLSAAAQLTPKEVTVTGGVMNVVLAGIKAAAGLATGSASLIADAGHSFSDLLSDGLCMLAASKPAYEQICTRGIGLMLLSAGGAMIVSSATMIATTLPRAAAATASIPTVGLDAIALAVALISIASKEALYRVTYAVGIKSRSSALVANAHHHRSDAMSSIAAAVGTAGTIAGHSLIDPLAALVVGGMVRDTPNQAIINLGTPTKKRRACIRPPWRPRSLLACIHG